MTHGNSITFSTKLDNKQLEKDLAKLTKKIEKTEQDIAGIAKKRNEAQAGRDDIVKKLEKEQEKLKQLNDQYIDLQTTLWNQPRGSDKAKELKAQVLDAHKELSDQQVLVRAIQTEWNQACAAVEQYNDKISDAEQTLDRRKEETGELAQQIEQANPPAARMGEAVDQAGQYMDRFLGRVKKLASRVFVFTLITSALRTLRTWLGKAIKANDEARQSIAQLKGALLTLAQPLVNIVIPVFVILVNVLTRVVTAIAGIVSGLFGSTIQSSQEAAKNLYGEMNALEGVGAAAEDAEKSMVSFDEINQLSGNIGGAGADGGDGAGSDIAPDFSFMTGMDGILDRLQQKLQGLIGPIGLIAAGFALWKISDLLPGALGDIAYKLAGLAIAIGSVMIFWEGLTDAWENGVDWVNLTEMIGGTTGAAIGLGMAFGPVAAGIALVVGGLAMLVIGFRDVMENGWNLENTLLTVSGIFATGLGIAFITGSCIPALIGAIVALLVAITVVTGHGEELIGGIRLILEGFKDFFTGIFTGDIEKAIGGIGKIFDGLRVTFTAVISGVRDMFLSFLTWLDEKTGGKFHGIIETAKGFVTAFYDNLAETVSNWLSGVEQAFSGLVTFVSSVIAGDWDKAWEGIKETFKGMWNSNIAIVQGAVNLIIKGLNWLISQMNKIQFDVPDWVPAIGGKSIGINIPKISDIEIPRLAQGAVIPPNREFLAVLGDQRSGTNIEAPAALIKQMVMEGIRAAGSAGGVRDINITLEMDRQVFARAVYRANRDETQRVGVNLAGVRT